MLVGNELREQVVHITTNYLASISFWYCEEGAIIGRSIKDSTCLIFSDVDLQHDRLSLHVSLIDL